MEDKMEDRMKKIRKRAKRPRKPYKIRTLWPAEKRMKAIGIIALIAGVCFSGLGFLFLDGFSQPFSLLVEIKTGKDFAYAAGLIQGLLYFPAGIMAIVGAAKKTNSCRVALKVACYVLMASSVVFSILIYNIEREYMMFGIIGFIAPPALLALEKQVIWHELQR